MSACRHSDGHAPRSTPVNVCRHKDRRTQQPELLAGWERLSVWSPLRVALLFQGLGLFVWAVVREGLAGVWVSAAIDGMRFMTCWINSSASSTNIVLNITR